MGLAVYKKKRKFNKTPEPEGGTSSGSQLQFVIQKHDASHLHYDFRLEMRGVLKSWAVPKGPSLDPSVKRLAIQVEDHPYDYKNFEGIIPKGEYGGGTVLVWDEGFYEATDKTFTSVKKMETYILSQLHRGKLVFQLHGQKLKGKFALVKSSRQENAWLLMKLEDKYAQKGDITRKSKSVISGRTIKQIENGETRISKRAVKKNSTPDKKEIINGNTGVLLHKQKFPVDIKPMLATLVDDPFDEEGWVFEIKWDGYRTIAFSNKDKVSIQSRNKKSFDDRFYPVQKALKELKINAVLDGEIVVINEKGISDFGCLQNWRSENDGEIRYYIFDLLWLDGYSLMNAPLLQRREKLQEIIPEHPIIKISELFRSKGTDFFKMAGKLGLEGIMAKKEDAVYTPGIRSKDWLKIKIVKTQEVVIGGYTLKAGSSKIFSSLLAGVYDKNKLRYIGKIGTGFTHDLQKELSKKFEKLKTAKSPFETTPDVNKSSRFNHSPGKAEVTWLKPEIVGEVSFTEMTSDGVMRHPSFKGLRQDKKASEVTDEIPQPAEEIINDKNADMKKKSRPQSQKNKKKSLITTGEKEKIITIAGKELKLTNLTKTYWPTEKISKGELINYYYEVAPYILPYLKDRPQSLNRHPNGIKGKSFYQKNVAGKFPSWIETHNYDNTTSKGKKKFFVCADEAHLVYMANLGCIEMNPWHSRITAPDKPDWCVIDLDPDGNPFNEVIEAANVIHQLLTSAGVKGYAKTSGSTGIHIYIPLGAKYDYEQSKTLAHLIVTLAHDELKETTSLERTPAKRKGKIYLDFLQNRNTQTIAAPFSVRPKPGATVSMPLTWEEVKPGLKISDFTIKNTLAEAKERDKLFRPVLGKGINLQSLIIQLEKL